MKKIGLSSTACLAAMMILGQAQAQEAITTPILTSVDNFRDVAGIAAEVHGIATGGTGAVETVAHDGEMRTGVFYRSNALAHLSDADSATMTSLGIGGVIDLRTPSEIAAAPDILPEGASYLNVNVIGSSGVSVSLTTPAAAEAFMQDMNRAFVTDATQRENLRTVLLELANASNAELYHCTAGKDRTGWVSALLQSIAGASSETIMTDYLATNAYSSPSIAATLSALPPSYAAIYAKVLGVEASYLQAGLDQVIASYGSMQAYLTEGLGLTQADLWVLRAKMVYYDSLPGQDGFTGNAAAGAGFLQALQNTPLSGHYTAFNSWFQSAIDAETLGGMQARVGGQVLADAGAFLLRQPRAVEAATATQGRGDRLAVGATDLWQVTLGGTFDVASGHGAASAKEQSGGPMIGVTHRFDTGLSAFAALGYSWATVKSAGAKANVDDFLVTAGGRWALESLEAGPFVAGRVTAGIVDYDARRVLGDGLGTARGSTSGSVVAGRLDVGHVFALAPLRVTPQLGVRVAHVRLDGFEESGSELALSTRALDETTTSLITGVGVSMDKYTFTEGWTIEPEAKASWEHAVGSVSTTAQGSLYDVSVSQDSAYRGRDLFGLDLGATLRSGDRVTLGAALNGSLDGHGSSGIGGKVSFSYRF